MSILARVANESAADLVICIQFTFCKSTTSATKQSQFYRTQVAFYQNFANSRLSTEVLQLRAALTSNNFEMVRIGVQKASHLVGSLHVSRMFFPLLSLLLQLLLLLINRVVRERYIENRGKKSSLG